MADRRKGYRWLRTVTHGGGKLLSGGTRKCQSTNANQQTMTRSRDGFRALTGGRLPHLFYGLARLAPIFLSSVNIVVSLPPQTSAAASGPLTTRHSSPFVSLRLRSILSPLLLLQLTAPPWCVIHPFLTCAATLGLPIPSVQNNNNTSTNNISTTFLGPPPAATAHGHASVCHSPNIFSFCSCAPLIIFLACEHIANRTCMG